MDQQTTSTRRKILSHVICTMLYENGFESCEKAALESLTEMLQSLLYEIGQSARNYCELSGRTEILVADVVLALVNAGIKLDGLHTYGLRKSRPTLPSLSQQTATKQLNILQAGVKQNHPSHIPNHMPPLPDPHAYIRTPTHKQPVTEYEAIREKAAQQKRDMERALTRFKAKIEKNTLSLFLKDDNSMFPLIPCTPQFPSYLLALLPQDQIFDEEEETSEASPVKKKKEKEAESTDAKPEGTEQEVSTEQNEESNTQTEVIDNPYLRPGKIPKNKVSPTKPESSMLSF